jgi:hypothetical protein
MQLYTTVGKSGMKLLNQIVADVLVTPKKECDGREFFDFALQLQSGEVYAIREAGGVTRLSSAEFSTETWKSVPDFAHLKGATIEGVFGQHGNFEPYVIFSGGMTLHVTGEECGTMVETNMIQVLRATKPWLVRSWQRVNEID